MGLPQSGVIALGTPMSRARLAVLVLALTAGFVAFAGCAADDLGDALAGGKCDHGKCAAGYRCNALTNQCVSHLDLDAGGDSSDADADPCASCKPNEVCCTDECADLRQEPGSLRELRHAVPRDDLRRRDLHEHVRAGPPRLQREHRRWLRGRRGDGPLELRFLRREMLGAGWGCRQVQRRQLLPRLRDQDAVRRGLCGQRG